MSPALAQALPVPGPRERTATRAAFLMVGVAMASWAPLVPLARLRLGLDEGQLGALLLFIGLGSVATMPVSGSLAGRYGCRRVILAAGAVACAALPFMAAAPSAPILAVALFAFGAGAGTIDVVMNIQAVIVEKAAARPMMSGFHGLFSAGGIAGAGAVSALLALGLSPLAATLSIVAVSAVLLAANAPGLLPYGSDEPSPIFALPRGRVLLIGALCFILFLAEGSVLDWSGILLATVRAASKSQAGLGYVAFSCTMTAGRLLGDRIVSKFGGTKVLALGGVCAAAGFLIAAWTPSWQAAILGFGLVGVGASNVVPVLFTAAGRQKAMPSSLAVAAVSTMGYAGILIGPALIGFVARAATLPVGLSLVAAMLAVAALAARRAAAA